MGYDIYGTKPRNKKGEYFRNNVWWWRRLWDLCVSVGNLTPKQAARGCSNDGKRIGKKTKERMLKGLQKAYSIRNGDYSKKWLKDQEKQVIECHKEFLIGFYGKRKAKKHKDWGKIVYQFSWENVKEFIDFLENNEGFRIW